MEDEEGRVNEWRKSVREMSESEWNDVGVADDWGDDLEDEWENDGGGEFEDVEMQGSEDSRLDVRIEIENLYYLAEASKRKDPVGAREKFRRCFELELESGIEEVFMRFKALQNLVALELSHPESREQMLRDYKALLELASSSQVSRNDSSDAINTLLNGFSEENGDGSTEEELFHLTIDFLRSDGASWNSEKLYFGLVLKQVRKYIQEGRFSDAEILLNELHAKCRNPDGSDNKSKGSQLLEVYALQLQLLIDQGNFSRLKEIFHRTKDLRAEVHDPKSMSMIHECWGKFYASEGNWDPAYSEFWEAFLQYQQIGSARAKQCLKYVVLANMLSSNGTSPFNSREAKVLELDPEIQYFSQLQMAFERKDALEFQSILSASEQDLRADRFIAEHLDLLLRRSRSQAIVSMVRPYRRMSLEALSAKIRTPLTEVCSLLVDLILDERLDGRIDQQALTLELNRISEAPGVSSLNRWTMSLCGIVNSLNRPALKDNV